MNTAQPHPLGYLFRLGIFLSGHHVDEFNTLPRWLAYRYALAGLALAVPVTMAYIGVRQFCIMSGGDPGLWPAVAAALVFVVDFLLVASLGGSNTGAAMLAISRTALAVAMSFWIAKPYVSLAYASQIAAEDRKARNAEKQGLVDQWNKTLEQAAGRSKVLNDHFQQEHQRLGDELKRITKEKDVIVQRILELDRSAERENLQGQDGRKSGQGRAWKYLNGLQTEKKVELAKLTAQEQAIRLQQLQLAEASQQELKKAEADPVLGSMKAATQVAVQQAQKAEAPSITEASDIIDNWVFAGSWSRRLGWIFIHIGLVMFDLLPLITKLLLPKTQIQRVAQINEERLAAEAEAARSQGPTFAGQLVSFRYEAALQKEKADHFKLMSDQLIQLAAHLVLRIRQAEVSIFAPFAKLSRRHPIAQKAIEEEWKAASKPLRDITERLIARFEREFIEPKREPPCQGAMTSAPEATDSAAAASAPEPLLPEEPHQAPLVVSTNGNSHGIPRHGEKDEINNHPVDSTGCPPSDGSRFFPRQS